MPMKHAYSVLVIVAVRTCVNVILQVSFSKVKGENIYEKMKISALVMREYPYLFFNGEL